MNNEQMEFPNTWEEFEMCYGFYDINEVYTNNSRLIPSFRVKQWLEHLEKKPCEMTVEEYRQRMIQAFHNADADELIAICVLPTEKEFEHLEWLLKNHYKKESCEDCISREQALKELKESAENHANDSREEVLLRRDRDIIRALPSVTPQQPKWIPLSERPLTDEERKEYGAEIGFVYDCELPEDSQDVLVTTPYGVRQTTFYTDYGCYFENYEDEGDVIAWMPLPEPYKVDNKNKQGLAYADQDTLMSAT